MRSLKGGVGRAWGTATKPARIAPLNWSHPLTLGLKIAWTLGDPINQNPGTPKLPFNESAIRRTDGAYHGSAYSTAIGRWGSGAFLDAVNYYISRTGGASQIISTSSATFMTLYKPTGTSKTLATYWRGPLFGNGYLGGPRHGITRGDYLGSDRLWWINYDGAEPPDTVELAYTIGQWYLLTWVLSAGLLSAYNWGKLIGSVASGASVDISQEMAIGGNEDEAAQGEYQFGYVWNRGLNQGEILHLTREPWAFFAGPVRAF